jgi:hypothetical protein
MAVETGTASGWIDFYNKLRDFLTTNADLIADGQEWTQIAGEMGVLGDADEIVLQGPGLAGSDEVLVGITPEFSVDSDYFNLGFTGMTMYSAILGDVVAQVNNSGRRYIYLWEDDIDYWFVANGRRFIVAARVSTNYFAAYCGFTLPYELPSLWPYPLFIGASDSNGAGRWSNVAFRRKNFFDPGRQGSRLMFPDVIWREVSNYDDGTSDSSVTANTNTINVEPWRYGDQNVLRENLDGSYSLQQARIACDSPYEAQLCALQGVYHVSGFSLAPGALIDIGGTDYLVVSNIYRTGIGNVCAIKLD